MIRLKQPLLWDGRIVPNGASIALPDSLERLMIAAGNGEYPDIVEQNNAEKAEQEQQSGLEDDGQPSNSELNLGRSGRARE